MIHWCNEAAAAAALILMALTARGFVPHARLKGPDPSAYLMQGILIGALAACFGLAVFDLIRPAMRAWGALGGPEPSLAVQMMQAARSLGYALAAWRVLKGLHAALPQEERGHYSWLTVAFYPRRIPVLWRIP